MATRKSISLAKQLVVFFRDRWLCQWCHRPVVFAPTFRLIEQLVRASGVRQQLSYFHPNWRRDEAPLLDHLGAVIDHREAHSRGGSDEESNLLTACNKCNARKNNRNVDDYRRNSRERPVRGKYGEPLHWDGLVSLFLFLANSGAKLTPSERLWAMAIHEHVNSCTPAQRSLGRSSSAKVPKTSSPRVQTLHEVAQGISNASPAGLGEILETLSLERVAMLLSLAHSIVRARTGSTDEGVFDPIKTTLATAGLDESAVWRMALHLETWPCTRQLGNEMRSRHPFSKASKETARPKKQSRTSN